VAEVEGVEVSGLGSEEGIGLGFSWCLSLIPLDASFSAIGLSKLLPLNVLTRLYIP